MFGNRFYKVTATPYTDGRIALEEGFDGDDGDELSIQEQISRRIINTRDEAVRQALISLGWTPPGGGSDSKRLDYLDDPSNNILPSECRDPDWRGKPLRDEIDQRMAK